MPRHDKASNDKETLMSGILTRKVSQPEQDENRNLKIGSGSSTNSRSSPIQIPRHLLAHAIYFVASAGWSLCRGISCGCYSNRAFDWVARIAADWRLPQPR